MIVVNIHSEIRAVIHQKKLSMLEVNSVDSRAILIIHRFLSQGRGEKGGDDARGGRHDGNVERKALKNNFCIF